MESVQRDIEFIPKLATHSLTINLGITSPGNSPRSLINFTRKARKVRVIGGSSVFT